MCGIFGAVHSALDTKILQQASDSLAHRGPDESGYYRDETIFLGHRRLSIIDLSTGSQPIFNEDRTKCIIFNGEVYNFPELREKLMARGHVFTTRSDTETILHAYEEYGEDCVQHLRGMFAFAIWEIDKKKLFVVRDRLGIKPLYYAFDGHRLYFASEIKAILKADQKFRDMDYEALAAYFTLAYIPAPFSIFKGIKKLPPAHYLTYQNGAISIKKYWNLHVEPRYAAKEEEYINRFMELLDEAVKLRLISDVPLGAFLSGGVDSSTIVALMSRHSDSAVKTFTMGFTGNVGGYLDERPYADMISRRYQTEHKEHVVQPELDGLIDTIVTSFDEPFADESSVPSYFVSMVTRQSVKVALSGLGGDELFTGYERHLGFALANYYQKVPAFMREKLINPLIQKLPERADGHYTINHIKRFSRSSHHAAESRYLGYLVKMDPRFNHNLFTDHFQYNALCGTTSDLVYSYYLSDNVSGKPNSLNRALYTDLMLYLPDDILTVTDRMSMHHALEVRVPFIDHKMVEYVVTIPPEVKLKWFRKKYLLKKAVKNLLPEQVINHRKQGFVGPTATWLKHDLKSYTRNALSPKNLDKHGLINPAAVQQILEEHYSGQHLHDSLIWSLIIFQRWFELYMDNDNSK